MEPPEARGSHPFASARRRESEWAESSRCYGPQRGLGPSRSGGRRTSPLAELRWLRWRRRRQRLRPGRLRLWRAGLRGRDLRQWLRFWRAMPLRLQPSRR
eukprot:4162493-Pleurochrysis_carterae.AAC.1